MKNQTDGGDDDRRKQEAGLDEALEQTFPASDPFSVGQFTATEPPSRPADRKAPRRSAGGGGARPVGRRRSCGLRQLRQRSMRMFCRRA